MILNRTRGKPRNRRGAAAVELAILGSLSIPAALIAVDFARLVESAAIVTESARNGAAAAMDPAVGPAGLTTAVRAAALASAADLAPPPTIQCTPSDDGVSVDVIVTYHYQGLFGMQKDIYRKVRMMRPPVLTNGT